MIEIVFEDIKEVELFNPATSTFEGTISGIKGGTYIFEHSLLSISKWESRWEESFFECFKDTKNKEEALIDYFHCMCIDQSFNPKLLTKEKVKELSDYISKKQTATIIKETESGNNMILTSEVLYGFMVMYNIPFLCEKWPLNRLITLIKVVGELNNPNKKKMPKEEIYSMNRRLNEERKKKLNTKG